MLGSLLLLMVIMAFGAVALTKGTAVLMGKFGGEAIRKKHMAAEFILEHRVVPIEWRHLIERRYPALMDGQADPIRREREREKAKTICLQRLDELMRHFKLTSLVADEETRELLLKSLGEARAIWLDADWPRMCGQDGD